MTIKKRFDYFFNNTTNCKRKCLEYVVVFGKLIFVVRGSWDGSIPYKITDENNKTRKGITGRVVKTELLDVSGVTYTKVLYKTKTRLSHSARKGYFNSFKNNRVYGLNLNLLTDPADLAFLFYDRIMIPTTFTIPSSITGDGILPTFLDGINFNGAYVTNAELFETKIFQNDKKFKKLIGKTVISKTTTTVQDISASTTTLPASVISNNTTNETEPDPNLIQTLYIEDELITDLSNTNLNNSIHYYNVDDNDKLAKFKKTFFIQFLWNAHITYYTSPLPNTIKINLIYNNSGVIVGDDAMTNFDTKYEIEYSLLTMNPVDTYFNNNYNFFKGLSYIKITKVDSNLTETSYCITTKNNSNKEVNISDYVDAGTCTFGYGLIQ